MRIIFKYYNTLNYRTLMHLQRPQKENPLQ